MKVQACKPHFDFGVWLDSLAGHTLQTKGRIVRMLGREDMATSTSVEESVLSYAEMNMEEVEILWM